jgi:hypothetical protein
MKQKLNPRRPGRGTKGARNPLLPDQFQGRRYKVSAFSVQIEVTIYDDSGKEERRFHSQVSLAVFEKNFGKSIPEIMGGEGLAMEGGKP